MQRHFDGEGQSFQHTAPGHTDIHVQKEEEEKGGRGEGERERRRERRTWTLTSYQYRDQLEMEYKQKLTAKTLKSLEENQRETFCDHELGNYLLKRHRKNKP